jgi:quercetin dioxygenase-like cupin family protein
MKARTALILSALIAAAALWGASVATAQQHAPGVKRTVLQKHDLGAPGKEGVMALVEIPAGAREGKHTHPADAFVYVIEGALTLEYEGKPATTYSAGQSFYIEPGKVHEGINNGSTAAKAVAVFVTEKGKPMTTQVGAKEASK